MSSVEDAATRAAQRRHAEAELDRRVSHMLRQNSPHARTVLDHGAEHGLLCQQVDPETFFDEFDDNGRCDINREQKLEVAKTLCEHCPVQAACRAWADDIGAAGFWGGTSETDRRRAREARQAAA